MLSNNTIQQRDAFISQWESEANNAENSDQCFFKVPSGEGLVYDLARAEMVKRYFPIADMPPGSDYYRLDIPVAGYV